MPRPGPEEQPLGSVDELIESALGAGKVLWGRTRDYAYQSFDAALPDAALALLVGEQEYTLKEAIRRPAATIAERAIDALTDEEILLLVVSSWRALMNWEVAAHEGRDRAVARTDSVAAHTQYQDVLRQTYDNHLTHLLFARGMKRFRYVSGEDVRGGIQRELEEDVSNALTTEEES